MFMKYKSLPKEIEAVRFTEENKNQVFNSLAGQHAACFENGNQPIIKVKTIHGDTAIIRIGDWIVKDGKPGTYYPIKNEIMERQYV